MFYMATKASVLPGMSSMLVEPMQHVALAVTSLNDVMLLFLLLVGTLRVICACRFLLGSFVVL